MITRPSTVIGFAIGLLAALPLGATPRDTRRQDWLVSPPHAVAPAANAHGKRVSAPVQGTAITRFFYLHPTDRPFRSDYHEAVGNAALALQAWFRQQLGGTVTFSLPQPIVTDVALRHTAEWYATHDPGSASGYGGDPRMRFWDNVLAEILPATGGAFYDASNAWVYYIDADSGCGQLGGAGGSSVTILTGNDLRGLVGEPYYDCEGNEDTHLEFPPTRWIGGQGHELGHAFGLPHPPGCDAGASDCDYNALMWAGFYHGFPERTYLRDEDRNTLLAGPFVREPTGERVNLDQRGLGGSWANAATDSQGFVIELMPDLYAPGSGLLFGGWFTYDVDPAGGLRWYTLSGTVDADATAAMLPIYLTHGGAFDSAQPTATDEVGVASIRFDDCSHGSLAYVFGDGSGRHGVIPIERLLQNVDCTPAADNPVAGRHLLSGAWADAGNSGQGFVFDIDPSQGVFFSAWYTFKAGAAADAGTQGQRWYTLQAVFAPGFTSLANVGIYESRDGVFDHAADTTTVQVGHADIVFHNCSSATMTYAFTAGEQAGVSGQLELQRLGPVAGNCVL